MNLPGGETETHATQKLLALRWAVEQGLTLAAPEVSFPHRRFRVDVAACCPERKAPARRPPRDPGLDPQGARSLRMQAGARRPRPRQSRRARTADRLRRLDERRARLESLLHLHLPHLANGESLFPEFDSYRLRPHHHAGYHKLMREITAARRALQLKTKFDRLRAYGLANLHYLVVEERLIEPHELPAGWGLLVRSGERLELAARPAWQPIGVEHQLLFLQRIAARKVWAES
ncbi:MAG: hypothetical protein WDO13_21650 [Verrucomicrobiota bacterium]